MREFVKTWVKKFGDPPTLVTLIVAVATVGLYCATRNLVDDAQTASRRQLRAYLGPGVASVADATSDDPKIRIPLKNYGSTPALDVRGKTYDHIFIGALRDDTWSDVTPRPHDFGIIEPGESEDMIIPLNKFSADLTLSMQQKDNAKTLHVKSCVAYDDIFGKHYTRIFTIYLNGSFITGGDVWQMSISPRENEEKESSDGQSAGCTQGYPATP
jgi:hypothetical protein